MKKLPSSIIISVLLTNIIPHSVVAEDNNERLLIAVTDEVNEYALNIVAPKLKNNPHQDLLNQLLLVVAILLDSEEGIAISGLQPPDFMNLLMNSKNKFIEKDSETLSFIATNNREAIRELHNEYMLQDPSGIFFAPSASDIIKYKSAFGCTHYARAFIAIVKSLKLIEKPEDLRYAIACSHDDYNECVSSSDKEDFTINGHQFVFVRIKEKWIALNTNRLNDYVEFPEGFSPDIDLAKTNIPIMFNGIRNEIFLLRKIGKNYDDSCEDSSFRKLMNIYRSGDNTSSQLNWSEFYLQNNIK